MKTAILLLFTIGFSNLIFGQIKSETRLKYSLNKKADQSGFHDNTSIDSCAIFQKEYNRQGNITKEYKYPEIRCLKINEGMLNYFYYDLSDRVIAHRQYEGEYDSTRILSRDFFYSYPFMGEPYKAIESFLYYEQYAKTRIEREQLDTCLVSTVDTKGILEYLKIGWTIDPVNYDTIRYDTGSFIFRQDFKRDKQMFVPDLILMLLNKNKTKDFEVALLNNLDQITDNLTELYETDESYICEFTFITADHQESINFRFSMHFMNIKYMNLNQFGDCTQTIYYKCDLDGSNLEKSHMIRSFIEYY